MLAVRLASRVEGNKAVYSIADTGLGIAPENLGKIWEVFRRIEEVSTPGEGLGLTIARRVIEHHGGRIWAESQPGVGSTFYVELPLSV